MMQGIHLISITEPLIFDLALAIKDKGYRVSVSGVGLTDTLLSQLHAAGCSCYGNGWFPEHIGKDIHEVVLGAAVQQDNPELLQAKKLGLLIQSIPEFIFQRTKSKTRVVVAGTHNKRRILSMIIYVLQQQKMPFDYAVSHEISLLPNRVSLGYESRIVLIEGDEHITSALDKNFQLEFYRPHIAVLSSLIWSEETAFSSASEYFNTFKAFVGSVERQGKLIYFDDDDQISMLAENVREDVTSMPYTRHEIKEKSGKVYLTTRYGDFLIKLPDDEQFLVNLSAANQVCRQLGIKETNFYRAISDYTLSL